MTVYNPLIIKYLKLGMKKFNLKFNRLKELIIQEENEANHNYERAINNILAGEKYSTLNLVKRESGGLITKEILLSLLDEEIKRKDIVRIENILFYVNYLKFRLEKETVEKIKEISTEEKILKLLELNQEKDEKVKNAEKYFEEGHVYAAYLEYRFAGNLNDEILSKIINRLEEQKQLFDLANILDLENKDISEERLKEFGDIALEKENTVALFYFYKLDSKEEFVKSIKKFFPLLVNEGVENEN